MQKIVKLNRVFLYCCMVVLFCLQQRGYAAPAQGKPVSLTIKNSSLAEVLRQVSKKSGLYIYFQDADLAGHRNVSLDAKNKPVESVLHELLDERGFSWVEVSENTIAVKKKLEREEGKVEMDTVMTITVTGKVVDEKGEPLPGATIQVKGSKIGTITTPSGDFVLNDVKTNASIVVSNVSFLTEEVAVKGRRAVGKIQLRGKVGELDEIVVIPYGSTTRRLNTGNVVSVKSKDIEKQPINNPLYALQGRVSGLQVTPVTGLAGGAVNLQIRGRNSLNNQSEPLIIIDGVPVVNNITGLGFSGVGLTQLSSLAFLNPYEIESIDVLKDADATSIYGSRGANGVILITTKKGRIGQAQINVNVQKGVAKVNRKIDMMNTDQYLQMRYEAISNANIDINQPPYNSDILRRLVFADVAVWDSKRYTNWQKELLGGTANFNDVMGSISGGVPNIQYNIGGNYHKETTVFAGDNSDVKGSVHISLTGSSTNQKLKAIVTATYLTDKNTLPGIDFTELALNLAPNAPFLYDKDGQLNWEPMNSGSRSWDNPYSQLYKTYDARVKNLLANAEISYQLISDLTIKIQAGYNDLSGNSFRKTYPFAGRAPEELSFNSASASFNSSGMENLSVEPQLLYQKKISKHNFNFLFGASYQSTTKEDQVIDADGATSDVLLKNLAAATFYSLRNTSSQYKYAAMFGRVNYNYNNKYVVNLSARRDGSSRFGPGKQYGNFGAVGLAWILSEEPFFSEIIPTISFAKLRFSYGTSGNDGIGDYQYMERYRVIDVNDPYQGVRGYTTTGLFNSYYAWEVTKKAEIGIETNLLADRISLNLAVFRNRSNNQLAGFPYPTMAGPGAAVTNIPAVIQNHGLEIMISTQNIKSKSLQWGTTINFTRNGNKLVSYPDIENSPYYQSIIGRPFFGEVATYNSAGVNNETGKYEFLDIDGKKTYNPYNPDRNDGGAYVRILNIPKFYGGISNTINYKNWSLDFLIQVTKQNGNNPLASFVPVAGQMNNLPVEFLDRWRKEGDSKMFQKLYAFRVPDDYRETQQYFTGSNFAYTDASFVRLKNVSLAYNIPLPLRKRMNINNCRVFVQGQNLLTITGYKGLDPESQSTSILPPLTTVTAGIQLVL